MTNRTLSKARKAKFDEFYTQYHDIEKEMSAYLDYDSDVFRGKTILLPCDDPARSGFTRYFAQNFMRLGLKKLISTSYAPGGNGKIFILASGSGLLDLDNITWNYLEGDGDFRGEEVTALRDEADFVITNPPFSLFREFLAWVARANKRFVILGNMNAIAYKEAFSLIRAGRMWLGETSFNTGMYFLVPKNFAYADTYKFDRERHGQKAVRVPGVCWFTNVEHSRRHRPLSLMTAAHNLRFNKPVAGKTAYDAYDNYDAIEVPRVDAIPSDYPGVMGVPVSFLDKYSPEQFEIVGLAAGNIRGLAGIPTSTGKHGPYVQGKLKYNRILIRHVLKSHEE